VEREAFAVARAAVALRRSLEAPGSLRLAFSAAIRSMTLPAADLKHRPIAAELAAMGVAAG
jgi:hypothetical protein